MGVRNGATLRSMDIILMKETEEYASYYIADFP